MKLDLLGYPVRTLGECRACGHPVTTAEDFRRDGRGLLCGLCTSKANRRADDGAAGLVGAAVGGPRTP